MEAERDGEPGTAAEGTGAPGNPHHPGEGGARALIIRGHVTVE